MRVCIFNKLVGAGRGAENLVQDTDKKYSKECMVTNRQVL